MMFPSYQTQCSKLQALSYMNNTTLRPLAVRLRPETIDEVLGQEHLLGTGSGARANQIIAGTVHAVVGAFYVYVYSDDVLKLTPNNNLQGNIPELAVADCAGATTDLAQVYNTSLPTDIETGPAPNKSAGDEPRSPRVGRVECEK